MPKKAIRPSSLSFFLACALLASCASLATATESELNSRWRGAWVLIGADTFSGCAGSFTNNEIRGRRAQSKGAYRFQAGELGSVYKINLNRKQVEVLIELAEPLLAQRQEGPFTLYDELFCKVELQFRVQRGAPPGGTTVDRLLDEILERHESRLSAQESSSWNRRIRDPYPEDYQDTLYEYEIWRAERDNAEVGERIDRALEEAARLVDRVHNDPDYLAGLGDGIDRARDQPFEDNCDRLLSRSVHSFVKKGSKDESRGWLDGYSDGQKLVFHLEIGRRLRRCFVPPPFS